MLKLIYSIGFTIFILASSFAKLYASDITAQQLRDEIITRKARVTQLNQISELALKFGIKVYLMGGLASSFAHYVHLDLRRESGEKKFRDDYFGYFWNQVFRESQDIDLAVDLDGVSADHLNSFKQELKNIFGVKKVDLHPTNENPLITDKVALNSQDFRNQHSDSASNGLIEITGSEVLDLRSSDSSSILSSSLPFLETMTSGTLHYLESPQHDTTSRAQQGLNPQLLSIIRYFINLSRYNLSPNSSQIEMINHILLTADVSKITGYALHWVENNAKKLMTQAYDLERTFKLIHQEFPIAAVITKVPNLNKADKSTVWWLSRRVLSSDPVAIARINRAPTGKTAKDLSIKYLGHATNQNSYLQISYNPEGIPNFILSVSEGSQHARYGEGLYTQMGDYGWKNFGDHHVRLEINQDAREGTDFIVVGENVVIVFNRDKIRVQSESSDPFSGWIEAVTAQYHHPENRFKVLEKASRIDTQKLSEDQLIQIIEKIESLLKENRKHEALSIIREIKDPRMLNYIHEILSGFKTSVRLKRALVKLLLISSAFPLGALEGLSLVSAFGIIFPFITGIVSGLMIPAGALFLNMEVISNGGKGLFASASIFGATWVVILALEAIKKRLKERRIIWGSMIKNFDYLLYKPRQSMSENPQLPPAVDACIARLRALRKG